LRLAGVANAARIGPDLDPGKIGAALAQKLGLKGPGLIGLGASGDIWIDRALAPADRKRMLDAAVAAYRSNPAVEAVFTADQIAGTPVPTTPPDKWSLIDRARASYYPGRSGDFVVVLKKEITPISDTTRYVATHGSAWDYDRRVPILFWRPGTSGATVDQAVETTDIMPTLAAMIGLPLVPGSIDGRCLAGVAGATCP
jgi:hypothetical protein